jgi:hypothetical protein
MGCASIGSSIPMDGGDARAWRCGRAIALDRKVRKLAEEFRSKGVLHSSWPRECRKRDRRSSLADNHDYLIRTPRFETDATPQLSWWMWLVSGCFSVMLGTRDGATNANLNGDFMVFHGH